MQVRQPVSKARHAPPGLFVHPIVSVQLFRHGMPRPRQMYLLTRFILRRRLFGQFSLAFSSQASVMTT